MKPLQALAIATALFLPASLFALSSNLYQQSWDFIKTHSYVRANVGLASAKPNADETQYFSPAFFNHYRSSSRASWQPDYSVSVGLRQKVWQKLSVQYGLGYYQGGNHEGKGTVEQLGLFPNLGYRYNVSNSRILATSRWQYQWLSDWASFVDVDMGFANVNAHGYSETALSPGVVTNTPFASKTTRGLAYQLGLGVDYHLANASAHLKKLHAQLGIGYLGLPKASLGNAGSTTAALSIGSVNALRVWLGVSYLF